MRILRRERERGAAILVVSSDLEEVMTIADRIAVMVSGRLVALHDAGAIGSKEHRARDRRGCGMKAETISSRAAIAERIKANVLPLAILFIMATFSLTEPAFLTPDNLIGIVRQVALIGIMAVCTTFVIMTGGVDLSVGPVLAIAGLVSYFCPASRLAAGSGDLRWAFRGRIGGFRQWRNHCIAAIAAHHRDACDA